VSLWGDSRFPVQIANSGDVIVAGRLTYDDVTLKRGALRVDGTLIEAWARRKSSGSKDKPLRKAEGCCSTAAVKKYQLPRR
jgi:hypothetical protein